MPDIFLIKRVTSVICELFAQRKEEGWYVTEVLNTAVTRAQFPDASF